MRQLLSHASGVPEHTTESLFAAVLADPARTWTPLEALAFATGPMSNPGHPVMDYSNSNYSLLGLLIERGHRADIRRGGSPRRPRRAGRPDGRADRGTPEPTAGRAGPLRQCRARRAVPAQPGAGHRRRSRGRCRRRRTHPGHLGVPALRRTDPSTGPNRGNSPHRSPGLRTGHHDRFRAGRDRPARRTPRRHQRILHPAGRRSHPPMSIAFLTVGAAGPALTDLIEQVLRTLTA